MKRVVLLGSSGFVGRAVWDSLAESCDVQPLTAPRLRTALRAAHDLEREAEHHPTLDRLVEAFREADCVVNAAGDPDASSLDIDALYGANALLPALILRACGLAGVARFVHVSSAVVQNDRWQLDSTEQMHAFTPYSGSKVMGEVLVRDAVAEVETVRYRPPSVHAASRRVTKMVRTIATSSLATVAAPGLQATPQALLPNVGAAVAALASWPGPVPAVVHHPSEGVTVTSLMQDLSGGRTPRVVPRRVARFIVMTAKALGRVHKPTAANARRVELLWMGQPQALSWLTEQGWNPPVGREGWLALADLEQK